MKFGVGGGISNFGSYRYIVCRLDMKTIHENPSCRRSFQTWFCLPPAPWQVIGERKAHAGQSRVKCVTSSENARGRVCVCVHRHMCV